MIDMAARWTATLASTIAAVVFMGAQPPRQTVQLAQVTDAPPMPAPVVPLPVQPKPVVVAPPAPVQPVDQTPITIIPEDADREIGACGDWQTVRVITSGGGGPVSSTWSVMPLGTTGLRVSPDGLTASFTNRRAGTYVFIVSVSGANGSVAHCYKTLKLVKDNSPDTNDPTQPVLPVVNPAPVQSADANDPASLIREYTAAVRSPNKAAEQHRVAGAFKAVADALDRGQPIVDPLGSVRATVQPVLPAGLGAWAAWFVKVDGLFAGMQEAGALQSTKEQSGACRNVASILGGSQ